MKRFLSGVLVGVLLSMAVARLGELLLVRQSRGQTVTAAPALRFVTAQTDGFPPGKRDCLPPGWERREFNGMVYFIQPLN